MKLYEEIIFLFQYYNGKFVVENVKSYYEPLIKPHEIDNHYFWSNFLISKLPLISERGIRTHTIEQKERSRGFSLPSGLSLKFKETILNNCVFSHVGLHVFESAFKKKQEVLKSS